MVYYKIIYPLGGTTEELPAPMPKNYCQTNTKALFLFESANPVPAISHCPLSKCFFF